VVTRHVLNIGVGDPVLRQGWSVINLRDAVIEGFTDPTLPRALSPRVLDRVIENSMAVRLGDTELARDVYLDIKEQLARANIRRYNLDITATLAP